MYNSSWLRPVSTGQAPTRSRPAGVRGSEPWARPAAWVLDHALQLESFTPSIPNIRVHIQVIITFMYTFKLFSTPALLYTRPCTPLPALLYTKYLRCKGTSSTIYYTHIQVILHALHSFTIWRPRGPAHHALHSDSFTPSTPSQCKGPTFTECLQCRDPTFTEYILCKGPTFTEYLRCKALLHMHYTIY